MNTRHAILYYPDSPFPNTAIMVLEEGKRLSRQELPDPCYTLADLAEVAYKLYITHLWIAPSYGEFEPVKSFGDWSFGIQYNSIKQMFGAVARKRGHSRTDVNIIFPQNTAWWGDDNKPGWLNGAAPRDMLVTLYYLEKVLGVPVGGSPGRAGWNYLKTIHPEWVEEVPEVNLRECHFTTSAGPDIIWQRPLTEAEMELKYVLKVDQGGSYPYAGTKTDTGVGTPEYKDHGRDMDDFVTSKGTTRNSQAVGVWNCTVEYDRTKVDPNMIPAWREHKGTAEASYQGWLAGPIIRLLRTAGHKVTAHEGWVFPEHHQVLTKCFNNLWDIRQGFKSGLLCPDEKARELAAKAVKFIANATIGLVAFRGFDEGDEMKRPDMRVQVIARHHELMWHNVNKIYETYGVTPIFFYMDAAYYLSDEPDVRKAFPLLVGRVDKKTGVYRNCEQEFGGYKYEGRVDLDEQFSYTFKLNNPPPPFTGTLRELVASSRYTVANKLTVLNAKGWVL